MHEFSIAEALLEATLQVASSHGKAQVERVCVRIGALRQVVPDLLDFAFQAITRDTLAEGAQLEWETVAAQVRCRHCETVFEPEEVFWICPRCAAPGGDVLSGEELVLDRVVLRGASNA